MRCTSIGSTPAQAWRPTISSGRGAGSLSETAEGADAHHFIRPGTDALLLLAMLHTIFDEGLGGPGRCGDFTTGLDEVRAVAVRFPPERVAAACGVDAATIRGVAREFVAPDRAVCYGRLGVSTQAFGSLACWLVNVLNVVAGRLDEPGGAMFTRPAVDLVGDRRLAGRGHAGRGASRVRGQPEFSGELPVAVLAEEIETPGPGQVRALVTSAGCGPRRAGRGASAGARLPRGA